ncbi:protein VACUOLELESS GAMETOPHYTES-like [Cornus florida]|uniref:protein VACUOLELESS GAMETOPHYTES-like n=1 Tax=Cornus florida TaxID=4283 RepID=UPI002897F199|nr:protein VACUOLELESS GAMETOPHYTES-like [Cornus florida]
MVCNFKGIHKGYRCNLCNFNLHQYCGTCPRILFSFMHPHPLILLTGLSPDDTVRISCNVCGDHVDGLVYRCHHCDFDVHPLCTQLPQYVRHVYDPLHPLRLIRSSSQVLCAVCGGSCTSWHYSCGVCGFDIHFQCVVVSAPSDPATVTRAIRPPNGVSSEHVCCTMKAQRDFDFEFPPPPPQQQQQE